MASKTEGKSAFQDGKGERGKKENGEMGGNHMSWLKRKSSRRGAGTWRRISSMMTHKKRTNFLFSLFLFWVIL